MAGTFHRAAAATHQRRCVAGSPSTPCGAARSFSRTVRGRTAFLLYCSSVHLAHLRRKGRLSMSLSRRVVLQTAAARDGRFRCSSIAPPLRPEAIKVGVLFSQSGGLSIIEKSLADATLMAISEINASGGVLGQQIQPIVEDGASDPKTFNEKASKLVIQDHVPSVFGCYTSASRKAVLPVFERRQEPTIVSDLLRRLRMLEERRLHRSRPEPATVQFHPLDHQDARKRRNSSSSDPTTSIRARWRRPPRY